jgi:hypothetical protein
LNLRDALVVASAYAEGNIEKFEEKNKSKIEKTVINEGEERSV